MKKITFLAMLAFLLSWQGISQTYLQENFDTEIPATWTITDEGGAMGDSWVTGTVGFLGSSLDGTNAAFVDSDSNGNGTLLVETLTSPVFDTTGAINLILELDQYYRHLGASSAIVEVYDGTNWIELLNQTATIGAFDNPDEQYIDITAYSNANMQIRFVYNDGDDWAWYWLIDNVKVSNVTCPLPSNLILDNATSDSANISWTGGPLESAWEIVIQEQGGGIPSGNGVSTVDNPYSAINLSPATQYEVYLRADCTGGDYSDWIGPLNFATACVTFSAPFTQGFENSGDIPLCWEMNGGEDWLFSNAPGFAQVGNGGILTGSTVTNDYYAWVDASGSDDPAVLISPFVDVSTLTTPALSFYEISDNQGASNSQLDVEVWDGAAWNLMGTYNTNTNGWEIKYIDLSPLTITGNVQARFTFSEPTPSGFTDDIAIDDVTFDELPPCLQPGGLNASNITGSTADISWTAGGGETAWEYVIQTPGTGEPMSGVPQSTTTVNETGLDYSTAYEVYVRSDCGDDGYSAWIGPLVFETTVQTNFMVDCSASGGPVNMTYCYENDDTNVFTFTSTDGTPLNFTINSGQVEVFWDPLIVYDSDGTTDLNFETPSGNQGDGDVSGITYQSTGDTISFTIESDGSVSCQSNNFTPIDVTVSCATCVNPSATYTIVDDCANGDQFLVDVDITSLGDATSLSIQDNQGNPAVSVSATGVVSPSFGPYPFNTDIIFTVSNEQDGNCVIISSPLTAVTCPPSNDDCINAIAFTANTDDTCTNFVSGTVFGATPSSLENDCNGTADDDVWFSFEAVSETHAVSLSNIAGPTTALTFGVYEGTDCDNLTNINCNNFNNELVIDNLSIGNTYYIRIFTFNDTPFQDVTFDLCVLTIPPKITADNTQYTNEELITDVLINSPCSSASNVTTITGVDFGEDNNGIAYFESGDANFPFASGIVMTTGNALHAGDPDEAGEGEGTFTWLGDADLEAEIDEGVTYNATIMEFDFVPQVGEISFNFIFAAEEYGAFQCGFSDAFAFLLTDLDTNTTTNLAVVPNTTLPVSVFTIRDNTYNGNCDSSFPELFDEYYGPGGQPRLINPTTFAGRTVPLTAMSTVTPGGNYHIKLVIADDGDFLYDSAVFLEAGSFFIGEIDLGDDLLQETQTAGCDGEPVILDLGEAVPENSIATWYTLADGIQEPIPGENGQTLEVTESGTYIVEVVYNNNFDCFASDQIVVEFYDPIIINDVPNIEVCVGDNSPTSEFDLTTNESALLEGQTNTITIAYYETDVDAENETDPITTPATFTASSGTTVFVRLDDQNGCHKVTSFELLFAEKPVLGTASDLQGCDSDNDGETTFNLTDAESEILGDLTDMTVTYYATQDDADNSINNIVDIAEYVSVPTTIYVRVETTEGCYQTTSFELVLGGNSPIVTIDTTNVYEVCPNATTPITILATAENFTLSDDVTISWWYEGEELEGETGLELSTVLDAGTYTIMATSNFSSECMSESSVEVIELETCVIPQGISPNDDDKNDSFDLRAFDVQSLEIYNRYGRLVYSKTNYTNEWSGQSKDGDELPVGTYYYVMKYQGNKVKAAWVYINREQ